MRNYASCDLNINGAMRRRKNVSKSVRTCRSINEIGIQNQRPENFQRSNAFYMYCKNAADDKPSAIGSEINMVRVARKLPLQKNWSLRSGHNSGDKRKYIPWGLRHLSHGRMYLWTSHLLLETGFYCEVSSFAVLFNCHLLSARHMPRSN